MMARDHLPFAAGCWVATAVLAGVDPLSTAVALPIALLGGLLPDVDHPSSKLGQWLPGLSHLTRATLGHRGPTHSLLFLILMGVGGEAVRRSLNPMTAPLLGAVVPALLVGVLSHFAADLANPQGVPLWWPRKARVRWPLLRWKSGSWVERLISWGTVGIATVLVVRHWITPALGLNLPGH